MGQRRISVPCERCRFLEDIARRPDGPQLLTAWARLLRHASVERTLKQIVREAIIDTYNDCGSMAEAARMLGISRFTVWGYVHSDPITLEQPPSRRPPPGKSRTTG